MKLCAVCAFGQLAHGSNEVFHDVYNDLLSTFQDSDVVAGDSDCFGDGEGRVATAEVVEVEECIFGCSCTVEVAVQVGEGF